MEHEFPACCQVPTDDCNFHSAPPAFSVEAAVLDRFRQMLGGNVRALIQVSDGPGNLQDAVLGPC